MTNYDFSTLNCTDLEDLVCELLNAEESNGSSIEYRTFKEGRDQGIDFLYSTPSKENEHVGQVKHYLKTGLSGLMNELRSNEVDKVKKLDPTKYIFVTSLPLSKLNCTNIKTLFNPYICDISDVYGQNDLNKLLTKHIDIEKSNYKLWFSSIGVLQTILKSDLEFRSTSFIEDELIKRIRLYVKPPFFNEVRESLKINNTIIITGEPGTGKTTLAEMLLFEYLKEGYKLSFIIDDVHDAERELERNDSKQIIYFDDFLGSNEEEISKARASEARLLKLISQVEKSKNKILILTTRIHLFSKAVSKSEKLQRKRPTLHESVIDLKEYDDDIKRQILKNHLEVSDLSESYKQIINELNFKDFIITHQNFSPRVIEFITSKNNEDRVSLEEFSQFVRLSLDSPTNIWEHAYLDQTDTYEKLLLQTLLTFGDSADVSLLEEAFTKRLEYEVVKNNLRVEPHCWKKTLRQLTDGFIIQKDCAIAFMNPSLVDFMINFIQSDKSEVNSIVESVLYLEQLSKRLFKLTFSEDRRLMPYSLQNRLLGDYESFLVDEYYDEELIRIALVIYQYTREDDNVDVLIHILNEVDDWSGLVDGELNLHFIEFVDKINPKSKIYNVIKSKITYIVNDVILGLWSIGEIESVIDDYRLKFNIEDFLTAEVIKHVNELFEDEMHQIVDDLEDWVLSEGDEMEDLNSMCRRIENFQEGYMPIEPNMDIFNKVDWFEVAGRNYMRYQMEKDD